MITESGIVTNANPSFAWIKTIRSNACNTCSSKGDCTTINDQKKMIVTVKNTLNVAKGDQVVIGIETGPALFLSFLLYIFPIVLLMVGALIGNSIASLFQMNTSFVSMVSGFLLFALAFYIIKKKNNSLAKQDKYKPFLVRKKSPLHSTDYSTS